jgi:hypothetical protein
MDEKRRYAVEIGESTMLGDLMSLVVDELKLMPKAWDSMTQKKQQEALDRIEGRIREASDQAINLISCRDMPEVEGTVDSVTFKNGAKATISFPSITPEVHQLADAQGGFVKIVIPRTEDLLSMAGAPESVLDQADIESYEGDPFLEDKSNGENDSALMDALGTLAEEDKEKAEEPSDEELEADAADNAGNVD